MRRSSLRLERAARRVAGLACLAGALGASAADAIFDAKGFSPEREFASELPFEHVDPLSGNLLLTFTDLVLPGGAGLDLRVQRTYNAKVYASYSNTGAYTLAPYGPLGVGWTMHFGRVLNPAALTPGPVIEMSDGSTHPAFLHRSGPSDPTRFMTREYWTYDRSGAEPVLRLPGGVSYTFGAGDTTSGPLCTTRIADAFGNRIDFTYQGGDCDYVETATQRFASGQTRSLRFNYAAAPAGGGGAARLQSLVFGARTWTFSHLGLAGVTRLRSVEPPEDPPWLFDYHGSAPPSAHLLQKVTSPNGGTLSYTYEARLFHNGSSVVYSPVLRTRNTAGPGISPGTWTYTFDSPGPFSPVTATIVSPCARTVYVTTALDPATTGDQTWRIGTLASKTIRETDGTLRESQIFAWKRSVALSEHGTGVGVPVYAPLLESRTVQRDGQTYVTTHTYDTSDYSPTRARNFNDYGQPTGTSETGQLTRLTARSYFYPAGPEPGFDNYIVGQLRSETVSVAGESFTKTYDYDAATGFLTSQSLYGIETHFAPDADGHVASRRDARGNTTAFRWSWGVPEQMQTPEYTVTRVIDSDSTVRSQTRRGFSTRYTYDGLFRLRRSDHPRGFPSQVDYAADGRSLTRSRGAARTVSTLDGFGRVSATLDAVGVRSAIDRDACGRREYESFPYTVLNTGTHTSYDALGRVRTVRTDDNATTSYTYLGLDADILDPEGRRTRQVWRAFGDPGDARLASVEDAGSGPSDARVTTTYEYNALGSLTRVVPGSGPARTWQYDTRNLLRQESHPETGTASYTYYDNGLVRTRTDAQFGLSTYFYDANDRLIGVDRPGSSADATFDYDSSDNRTLAVRGEVRSEFGPYDGNDNLTARRDKVGARVLVTSYDYDGSDRLERLRYPSGAEVRYQHDAEGRITRVEDGNGAPYAHTFQYHPSGAPTSFVAGNGTLHQQTFHARRYWPESAASALSGATLASVSYGHDRVGNVTSLDDYRLGRLTLSLDPVDRLRSAQPTTVGSAPFSASFGYDAVGNRTQKTLNSATTTYSYDAATQRLATASGSEPGSFGYDGNGNTLSDAAGSYTYDADNLQASATVGGLTTRYAYDTDSLRKRRESGTATRYFVHGPGGQLLSELDLVAGELRPLRDYVYAGTRLLASVRPPVLSVTPATLSFAAVLGSASTPAQSVAVATSGTPLPWQAQTSATWMVLSTSSGSTPATFTVRVNPAGLAVGTHVGSITVSAPGALGGPRVIVVRAAVVPQAGLVVLPRPLTFRAVQGERELLPQTLDVLHAGTPTSVAWTAVSTAPWLSFGPTSGTTPARLEVRALPGGLAAGTHRAALTVTAPTAVSGSPKLVPVELIIEPAAGASCALAGTWYCERFDGLALGVLGGQGGWVAQSEASARVSADPRGSGQLLRIDPVSLGDGTSSDIRALAGPAIDGSEISVQVMTEDCLADAPQVAKLEFYTAPGVGWGKSGRTYGALRVGSKIYLQYGPNVNKILVGQVQSGRFYQVRVAYRAGRLSAYVDGQLRFEAVHPVSGAHATQAFVVSGWDRPGRAHLDLLEGRLLERGLVVSPQPLRLTNGAVLTTVQRTARGPQAATTPGSQSSAHKSAATPARLEAPNGTQVPARATTEMRRLAPAFEPNAGQFPAGLRFVARDARQSVSLVDDGLLLGPWHAARATGGPGPLRLRFEGARPIAVEGVEPLPGRLTYLTGRDPRAWLRGLQRHGRVRYAQLYPGIDLEVYLREHELEYDLVVAPGAELAQVRLAVEGSQGVRLDEQGDLLIDVPWGRVRQRRPQLYQERDGRREAVAGRYLLSGDGRVTFTADRYDPRRALVVDPVLVFSTYLGGGQPDAAQEVAIDEDGGVYVAGRSVSPALAGVVPLRLGTAGLDDVFVAKLNPSGTAIEYLTYLGGALADEVGALAVDGSGRAYLAGTTASTDFPVTPGAAVTTYVGGPSDAFVLRLSADGATLEYATYLGGTGADGALGLALDRGHGAIVGGRTDSADFPLTLPLEGQTSYRGGLSDGFVAYLSSSGANLVRSTYLGGSATDEVRDVAYDPTRLTLPVPERAPAAYAVGWTDSADFPVTPGAYRTSLGGGSDGFVAKLFEQETGGGVGGLRYSTFVGSPSGHDEITAAFVDGTRAVHVCGKSDGAMGVVGAVADGGRTLTYWRALGHLQGGLLTDISVDGSGYVTVVGYAGLNRLRPDSLPLVDPLMCPPDSSDPALCRQLGKEHAAYVARFAPQAALVRYGTELGFPQNVASEGATRASSVATDEQSAYVVGTTESDGFLTANALQNATGGLGDAFVAKLLDPGGFDPRLIEFAAAQATVPEEGTTITSSGAPAAAVTVRRSGSLQQAASVECTASAGTAAAGLDFVPGTRTLTFAAGEASATCLVELVDDALPEATESVALRLANPSGGILGDQGASTLLIQDNDGLARSFRIFDRVLASGPNWTITETIPWLSFSALAGLGPSTVVATADPSGLPPGTYSEFFTVSGDTGDSPQYIEAILTVRP